MNSFCLHSVIETGRLSRDANYTLTMQLCPKMWSFSTPSVLLFFAHSLEKCRVLMHVDTDKSDLLVNRRFAYVSEVKPMTRARSRMGPG